MAPPFSLAPLLKSLQVFGVANALGWSISFATRSHLHLDLIGTGAFVVAAATALPVSTTAFALQQKVSAAIIGTWGARLASFLFYRALQVRRDARLDDTLSTLPGTTAFWFISAVWGVVCFLPHALAAGAAPCKFGPIAAAGAAVAIAGLCIEALADFQKWNFKQDPTHRGKFCDVGLWAVSQHPNYFGNIVLWSGVLVLNAPRLLQGDAWAVRVACLSPLFMYLLFSSQANGQMTNSKELSLKKYGTDAHFKNYTEKVPLIFPWGKGFGSETPLRLDLFSLQPRAHHVEDVTPSLLAVVFFMFALTCVKNAHGSRKRERGQLKPLTHV